MTFARATAPQRAADRPASVAARASPLGNQAHLRRLAVQPKLRLGEPDHALEREADRVADQVMSAAAPAAPPPTAAGSGAVQRACAVCGRDPEPVVRRKLLAPSDADSIEVTGHINKIYPDSAINFGTQIKAKDGKCPATGAGPKCACDAMTDGKKTYHVSLATMNPIRKKQKVAGRGEESVPFLPIGPATDDPVCTPHTFITIPKSNSTAVFGSFDKSGGAFVIPTPRILAHELCGHGVNCETYDNKPTGQRPLHDITIATENSIFSSPERGKFTSPRQGESWFRAPGETKLVFEQTDGLHYEDVAAAAPPAPSPAPAPAPAKP